MQFAKNIYLGYYFCMENKSAQIIAALGGTGKAASFFKVTPGAVSQWITNGIPNYRLQTLKFSHPKLMREINRPSQSDCAPEVAGQTLPVC